MHNLLFFFSFLLSSYMIIFLFLKAEKGVAKMALIMALFCTIIFELSQIIGVSVYDSELSRRILMFNVIVTLLPVFTTHTTLAFIKQLKEQRKIIISFYTIGIGLVIYFILNPLKYLLTSEPKMYFPNYYEAGPQYFLMLIFFFLMVVYSFYILWKAYKIANFVEKNRIKYFGIALFFGYLFGSIDFLLVYNIQVNPLWAFLFIPLFAIPLTYAAVQYELMDVKIIAKKSFIYIITSAVFGLMLVLLNYINTLIIQGSTNFPRWVSSILMAFIITSGLLFFWKKIRESDFLKYEFIKVITHKFRTPLTAIKWYSEDLIKSIPENLKGDVEGIKRSANNLISLTNLLVSVADYDRKVIENHLIKINLRDMIVKIIDESNEIMKIKKINVSPIHNFEDFVFAHENKLKFVFQTIIDNAIIYNKEGGKIEIEAIHPDENNIIIKIENTGIGLEEKDRKYIFTNFYRSDEGKKAHTEGMGIGLYLSKTVLGKIGGKIWVESEGRDKGASFFVKLPKIKDEE